MTELGNEAARLVAQARHHGGPTASQRAAMRAALEARLAAPAPPPATAAAARGPLLLKGLAVLGAAAVVATLALRSPSAAPAESRPAQAPAGALPPANAPSNLWTLEEEVAALDTAAAAAEAGRWAEVHERTRAFHASFPGATLAVEADALDVTALCGLGKADEARALAQRLVQAAPANPAVVRLGRTCAGPANP